jgi:isopentenyl-diphosphate Delta-isomerase
LTSSEIIEVVDEKDRVLFLAPLDECKRKGLLHRTVCVFLRNRSDQILLQQRSLTDDWLPGKWTVSCSGHIKAGERSDDAACRELKEELGIEEHPSFLFKQFLPPITWSESIEHEVAYAFECVTDAKVHINTDEVEQVKFVTPGVFKIIAKSNPEDFTPDAIILLQRYLQEAENTENEPQGPRPSLE